MRRGNKWDDTRGESVRLREREAGIRSLEAALIHAMFYLIAIPTERCNHVLFVFRHIDRKCGSGSGDNDELPLLLTWK